MSKNVLELDYDYDFQLIGLVTSIRQYRLAWFLNQTLGTNLAKDDDLEFTSKRDKRENHFSVMSYSDELNKTEYFLISNKEEGQFLLKELKLVDQLLMIRGTYASVEIDEMLDKIGNISTIQTSFSIDPSTLKEKENLQI